MSSVAVTGMRVRAKLLFAVGLLLITGFIVPQHSGALVPSVSLTLDGPSQPRRWTPVTYTGSLLADGQVPVAGQQIQLLADNVVVGEARTGADGRYAIPTTFKALGSYPLVARYAAVMQAVSASAQLQVEVLPAVASKVAVAAKTPCALIQDWTVRCWGAYDWHLQADGLAPVTAIDASDRGHFCAVTLGGAVACGGLSDYGQAGSRNLWLGPVSFRDPTGNQSVKDATSITVGEVHSCSLISNGTVRCWGANYEGQLGDGRAVQQTSKDVQVKNMRDAVGVTAGRHYTCAVRQGGTVACWGGPYGMGPYGAAPADLPGIQDAIAIDSSLAHVCAVLRSGGLMCWGDNGYGQIGSGSSSSSAAPTMVSGLDSVSAVSAGEGHSCAITADGSAWCWGRNGSGELGDGTTSDRSTPVRVEGLPGVVKIEAGPGYTCAIDAHGGLVLGAQRRWAAR